MDIITIVVTAIMIIMLNCKIKEQDYDNNNSMNQFPAQGSYSHQYSIEAMNRNDSIPNVDAQMNKYR